MSQEKTEGYLVDHYRAMLVTMLRRLETKGCIEMLQSFVVEYRLTILKVNPDERYARWLIPRCATIAARNIQNFPPYADYGFPLDRPIKWYDLSEKPLPMPIFDKFTMKITDANLMCSLAQTIGKWVDWRGELYTPEKEDPLTW